MSEVLYTLDEIKEIAEILGSYGGSREFHQFINDEFKDLIYERIPRHLIAEDFSFDGSHPDVVETIKKLCMAYMGKQIPMSAVDTIGPGWGYEPMARVVRPLYNISFDEIPLHMNHMTEPFEQAIFKWRLEKAGK